MTIRFQCSCGRRLAALDRAAGKRCECLECGRELRVPESTADQTGRTRKTAPTVDRAEEPLEITDFEPLEIADFLDPPAPNERAEPRVPQKPVALRMLEALLDPRAIHWMLILGGGLTVLGIVVWLVSLGLFKDPWVVGFVFGVGSLGLLVAGWWITLRTKFHVAGQALTFLGCVVLPLNLWFSHAQNLITLDEHLWVGGLICVGLYAATVFLLRDPLFLYAFQAGSTLTAVLLLGHLHLFGDAGYWVLFLGTMGALSIHAERAFTPDGEFNQRRYGLPLFWSGHLLLLASLFLLLTLQAATWLAVSLQLDWQGNWLTANAWLSGCLWLVATYLYVYSDLVVRKLGIYTYLAGGSLMMALATLVLPHLNQEGLIAVVACAALAIQLGVQAFRPPEGNLTRHAITVAIVMAKLALLIGVILHLRATSVAVAAFDWSYSTGWGFVAAMLVVVATNRIGAHFSQNVDRRLSEIQFFLSAAGLLVAAAGLLRQFGWTDWSQQAPLLMLIPLGCLAASRFWRGRSPEAPLAHVAHTATVVIFCSTFVAALARGEATFFRPLAENPQNLLLGLAFVEAAIFYSLAVVFRRHGGSVYLAAAAGCAALWQFVGYFGIVSAWYVLLFALLGIALLAGGRRMGLREVQVYRSSGRQRKVLRGKGLALFQSGAALLSIALTVAVMKGLGELALGKTDWSDLVSELLTASAGMLALALVPTAAWRRWFAAAAVTLAGVVFLRFQVLLDLSAWRKFEMLLVGVGLAMLAAGHIGRFRENDTRHANDVTLGLWFGSLLAIVPPFVAMISQRVIGEGPSLYDELGLLTIAILMLVSGCSWQIKSTTLVGGCHLALYLLILVGSIAYRPQVAVGVYLLIGGGLIFLVGVVLSMYREYLIALPGRFGRREGLFRVIDWR